MYISFGIEVADAFLLSHKGSKPWWLKLPHSTLISLSHPAVAARNGSGASDSHLPDAFAFSDTVCMN